MGVIGVKLYVCVQLWIKILKQSTYNTISGWLNFETLHQRCGNLALVVSATAKRQANGGQNQV